MSLLERLNSSCDIKQLNIKDLQSLADEIREKIISVTAKNGGHLSSNLGIVEATIALYKTFDFPSDKIVFDVGHQCYAHKILSGRKESFDSIRLDGGISGFPDIEESEFDVFSSGHAGTSISAGIGLCTARDLKGENYTVISVVGDGSFSNGLNLEALSASSAKPKNFIVVLNDNGMSISKNKNGFYHFISKGTTKKGYIGSKKALVKIFGKSFITRGLSRFKEFIKRVLNRNDYFENHGFKYVGVVDGNDIKELSKILERVKSVAKTRAVLLHIKTTKGKGLKKAEEHADTYHGVGTDLKYENGNLSLALGKCLVENIENDKDIIAITAGMKDGTGLIEVEKSFPKNFVDVGIAEEYAVTLAAGMARGGLKPFVGIYSTFMQRAYDQILHDVCLQNLPVVLCLDRAGLVGHDGKTHQGVYDISYLSHMPNMTILAPNNSRELKNAVDYAIKLKSPVAIRYPKNGLEEDVEYLSLEDGLFRRDKIGNKLTLLALGPNMLKLARKVSSNQDGIGVISVRAVKPLCEKTLLEIKDAPIITLEENSEIGGFGSLVEKFYREKQIDVKLAVMGVKDKFVMHGSLEEQLLNNNLDEQSISHMISRLIN